MRDFYIIGHNPNTVTDAINYLRAGANALEPDVHYTNGNFYMGEGTTSTDVSLTDYLQGLTQQLKINPSYVPALVMFDTKNSNGSISALLNCIQENFSYQYPGTSILITRSQVQGEEHTFFAPAATAAQPASKAFGIDEHTEPEVVDAFVKSLNIPHYTYADGISIQIPLLSRIFWERIKRAIAMRDKGDSFKLVYSWTLDIEEDIKAFLHLNPDGLITDSPGRLKQILESAPFSTQYQLAKPNNNLFA